MMVVIVSMNRPLAPSGGGAAQQRGAPWLKPPPLPRRYIDERNFQDLLLIPGPRFGPSLRHFGAQAGTLPTGSGPAMLSAAVLPSVHVNAAIVSRST